MHDLTDLAGPAQHLASPLAERLEYGVHRCGQLGLDLDVADLPRPVARLEIVTSAVSALKASRRQNWIAFDVECSARIALIRSSAAPFRHGLGIVARSMVLL